MSREEAAEVLSGAPDRVDEVVAITEGWPAVIGLAAHANSLSLRNVTELAPALHSYVADELYSSLNEGERRDLVRLSLLPVISKARADELLEKESAATLAGGGRAGFLTEDGPDEFAIHPLLRSFLHGKFKELPSVVQLAASSRAVRLLLDEHAWDAAITVLESFERADLLEEIIEASLYDLLSNGLLATLSKLVRFGRAVGSTSPLLDLAEAELSFRRGLNEQARPLAEQAGRQLISQPFASKAFRRAGHCAYFEDDIGAAIRNFQEARRFAEDIDDQRSAIWGLFLAAIEQEDDAAVALLEEYELLREGAVDELVRLHTGRLLVGMRLGSLAQSLPGAEAVASFVESARDPAVRASFWHGYAGALRIAADYDRALEVTDTALREVAAFDLAFAKAHVYLTRAGVYASGGAYSEALALLDEVCHGQAADGDAFLQVNAQALRCRIFLSLGDIRSALRASAVSLPRVTSTGQYSEFLACRALALGLSSQWDAAFEVLRTAEASSCENEASTLCLCVRSLLALAQGEQPQTVDVERFRSALAKRILDPLVFAIRLDRRLPRVLAKAPELGPPIEELVAGLSIPEARGFLAPPTLPSPRVANAGLTAREQEVYALIAGGKSNKEIANLLFVTEATAKVHVRHILQKLGVRTRTEAAILAVRMQQREGEGPDRLPLLSPDDPPE